MAISTVLGNVATANVPRRLTLLPPGQVPDLRSAGTTPTLRRVQGLPRQRVGARRRTAALPNAARSPPRGEALHSPRRVDLRPQPSSDLWTDTRWVTHRNRDEDPLRSQSQGSVFPRSLTSSRSRSAIVRHPSIQARRRETQQLERRRWLDSKSHRKRVDSWDTAWTSST